MFGNKKKGKRVKIRLSGPNIPEQEFVLGKNHTVDIHAFVINCDEGETCADQKNVKFATFEVLSIDM